MMICILSAASESNCELVASASCTGDRINGENMLKVEKATHNVTVISLLTICMIAVSGCAFLKGSMAKSKHIRQQTENHTYNQPLEQVWGQARQMLFAEGYEVKDSGPQDAETEWKVSGNERTRYLLSGIVVSDTSCKVQFTKASQSKGENDKEFDSGTITKRDLDLEYKLIKTVDPAEHSRIEKEAQAKYDGSK